MFSFEMSSFSLEGHLVSKFDIELIFKVYNFCANGGGGGGGGERDITHVFQDFNFFLNSRSLKCSLHIASYTLRIGAPVMEL